MNLIPSLSGSHLRTYETIFQHPISHNLEWRSVRSLLERIGQVTEETNGHLKVTLNGQSLSLARPHSKDLAGTEELLALRHFLERSGTTPAETNGANVHWLLVIDHQVARVFHAELEGAIPIRILPHDPQEHFQQAQGAKDFSHGKEKPNLMHFFEPIAKILMGDAPVLVFGTGTGSSSEMDLFIAWSKLHHPELAQRIVGSVVVNENHLTEAELLAKAREFYAHLANPKSYRREHSVPGRPRESRLERR